MVGMMLSFLGVVCLQCARAVVLASCMNAESHALESSVGKGCKQIAGGLALLTDFHVLLQTRSFLLMRSWV